MTTVQQRAYRRKREAKLEATAYNEGYQAGRKTAEILAEARLSKLAESALVLMDQVRRARGG